MPDIRIIQIVVMICLLGAGAFLRDFSISSYQIALSFSAACLTQALCTRSLTGKNFLSPIITAIGISLLLRSNSLWVHPLAASVAIASKFYLRIDGKHFLNPANFGVIFGVFISDSWISPGQWGSDIALTFWIVALGSIALSKVGTYTITLSFLAWYFGIWSCHRVLYLGYEWSDLFHQFQSGALLLFAFFMISDPKTSPRKPSAQVGHALLVAVAAYLWHYYFYYQNGYLYALFFLSLLVPVWNKVFSAPAFQWGMSNGEYNEQTNERPQPFNTSFVSARS